MATTAPSTITLPATGTEAIQTTTGVAGLTDGSQVPAHIPLTASKGSTPAGWPTSTAESADVQAAHVHISNLTAAPVPGTINDATTPTQGAAVDTHGSQQVRVANSGGTELFTTTTPGAVQRGEGYSILTAAAVTSDPVLDCGDVLAYSWVSVHITTNASADTVAFQCSNDNVTYVACTLFPVGATTAGGVTSTTTVGMWEGVLPGRYFKLAHTAGANAVSATVVVRQTPGIQPALGATVSLTPSTSAGNGGTVTRTSSAANTTGIVIKSSSGIVEAVVVANVIGTARYLKIYNKSSAPTVGTDTPVLTAYIAPTAMTNIILGTVGMGLSSGIGIGITTGAADNDTGAPGAGDILVSTIWK